LGASPILEISTVQYGKVREEKGKESEWRQEEEKKKKKEAEEEEEEEY
jgi:hypothetical protein